MIHVYSKLDITLRSKDCPFCYDSWTRFRRQL